MLKEKICKFCNQPFIPTSGKQLYCKRPHYMNCPVCGKQYLVTNNENLKRPPVACSYACRAKRTRETSMKKYGVVAPGNNVEARAKAKRTMIERYGGSATLQCKELSDKAKQTMIERYGVDNPNKSRKLDDVRKTSAKQNRIELIHNYFPLKIEKRYSDKEPHFIIDENAMNVFLLKEKASVEFLKHNGCQFNPKFGRIHQSFGLVKDGILYQVIRFEKRKGQIWLANLGTRNNYVNPNGYSKLLKTAINITGVEEFSCEIPRSFATDEVTNSLSLELVRQGEYIVYWKTENGLKKYSNRDNIEEMKSKYEYVTTDYLDLYSYTN